MSSGVSKEKIDEQDLCPFILIYITYELEKRIETLELMVDEKLREKIAQGLKDEEEGKVISLEEYEEKYC